MCLLEFLGWEKLAQDIDKRPFQNIKYNFLIISVQNKLKS